MKLRELLEYGAPPGPREPEDDQMASAVYDNTVGDFEIPRREGQDRGVSFSGRGQAPAHGSRQ